VNAASVAKWARRADLLPVLARLPAYGRLTWRLLRDPRLSRADKAILLGGAAYLVSPVDLIPGLVPILGLLDDLNVVLWIVRTVLRRVPPEIGDAHLAAAGLRREQVEEDGRRVFAAIAMLTGVLLAAARRGLIAAGGRVARRLLRIR
jgi:uncharacterized membrane protein YkvA (DUF1232 family)